MPIQSLKWLNHNTIAPSSNKITKRWESKSKSEQSEYVKLDVSNSNRFTVLDLILSNLN